MQNEQTFLKIKKKKRKRVLIGSEFGQLLGVHNLAKKSARALGKEHLVQDYIRVCFVFYVELEITMVKGISESYTFYLVFLVCRSLYDFNLTGTREVFKFFLMFGI